MKTMTYWLAVSLLSVSLTVGAVGAHCEIPCGIYDDAMRLDQIAEHIKTIETSMNKIHSLARETPVNYNQLIRWVTNKETHANEIQHIATQYFMTQRIKPDQKQYTEKLAVLHKMLLSAMKCKQTTDLAHIKALRSLLKDFEVLYFGEGSK